MEEEDIATVGEGLLKLVSGDGFSFVVEEEHAKVSKVIQRMMMNTFKESRTKVIHLPEFSGCVLEKICQYFYYMARFKSRQRQQSLSSTRGESDAIGSATFDSFADSFHVPQGMEKELILCAFYLDL